MTRWRYLSGAAACALMVGAAWGQTGVAPVAEPPLNEDQLPRAATPSRTEGPMPGGSPLPDGTTTGQSNPAAREARAPVETNVADGRPATTARVRDPNYRWHNNHWWYRTPKGWVFWYDNRWRPYDRATYYSYYPRGWYGRGYYREPYRSYYRGGAYGYRSYDPGWRRGYYYGWPRTYNRGWYDGGLRFGGRGVWRW